MLEQQFGRPLTHEYRHYVAGKPVHCGDTLEAYLGREWVFGRYEWTGNSSDEPTLHALGKVYFLDGSQLLRWPD